MAVSPSDSLERRLQEAYPTRPTIAGTHVFFFFWPYKIERRTTHIAWATYTIIILNVIVFAAGAFDRWGVNQAFGMVASRNAAWGWFTSMFLHADLFHLFGNMFFLWLFGCFVEEALGTWRFLALYIIGGFVAAFVDVGMTAMFSPARFMVTTVGASGALAAVMGLFTVRFYKHKIRIFHLIWILLFVKIGTWKPTALVGVGLWLLDQIMNGMISLNGAGGGVAYWAHIGGMLFGIAFGLMLGSKYDADTEYLTDEASALAQSGTHSVAAAKYAELKDRTPDDPEAIFGEARSLVNQGTDPQKASEDLRRAVELWSRQGEAGRILLAWDEIRSPVTQTPVDPKTLSTVASVAEGNGRPDIASELYWRLVQDHAGTHEAERALFRLAHIYLASGMTAEAGECWNRFRAQYPHSEWLAYADPAFVRRS